MNKSVEKTISHPAHIAYVIDQMGVGGTEQQLAMLLRGLDLNLFLPLLVTIHEYEKCYETPAKHYLFPTYKLVSFRGPVNVFRMASLFRRERVQIVQAFFFDAAALGIVAARLARVPIKILSRRDMGFWETPLKRRVMNMLDGMSDRLLVNSESVRRRIMETEGIPSEKIDVICNGIDTKPFSGESRIEARAKFGIAHEAPVVGLVSNLNREVKRVDLFLEAAAIVAREYPDVRFLIAGEGHLREALQERSRVIGLNGAARFLGSERDIPSLLNALDVGVNCSDSEGMSNAVVEFMAAGVPSVVSAVPGNCEIVDDGVEGLHFPAGDAPALASRIKLLLADPQRARQMGARGREKARRRFSSKNMIQQHTEYYLKLLRARG